MCWAPFYQHVCTDTIQQHRKKNMIQSNWLWNRVTTPDINKRYVWVRVKMVNLFSAWATK